MSERTPPPFALGEQTKIRLPLLMLLSLLGVVAAGAVVWSGDHKAVADLTETAAAHEARLRKLEEGQTRIELVQRDVEWMRRMMEQQTRDRRAP